MSRFDPLDWDRHQWAFVQASANLVAPQWRERFRAAVAGALVGKSSVSMGEISEIVAKALRAFVAGEEDSFDDCCGG
jgi:hypothetical protein